MFPNPVTNDYKSHVVVNQVITFWLISTSEGACDLVLWFKGLTMDAILDSRCMSQVMQHDDQPPPTIVKKVSQPWTTLPMNMNFPSSHVFHDDGPRACFWIQNIYIKWNLILMNKNMLWGSIPTCPSFWHIKGHQMSSLWWSHGLDFTYIINLGFVK